MALDNESFNKQLYDLLKVRGYKPVPKNAKNQDVEASQLADVIEFQFIKDGENYGKAWASIDDAQNVIIYYDDDQADSPEGRTPGVEYDDSWSGFLQHVKNWAQRKQLSFELLNKDRLSDDMRQREYIKMKENISEGYYPMGKQASYSDAVPTVKIVLQHTRQIQEGEQRYRNVAKIFLENQLGERILAPTTRPGIAQVYARHLAEGGVANDERWNHIKSICEEYQKMAGFVRATRNGQFNESAQELVNEGVSHYNNLRETLGKLRGHRGYNAYFESWTPTLMEDDSEETNLNELFVQETVDPRIESAMPILSRLRKHIGEMAEVKTLESWADDIINEKMDSTTASLAVPADKMLDEAPGAETLAHNQNTEKSNLKAFDLAEEEGRPYICVHAKKGKFECHANSSYEAAKKAAQKWGLKSTAGIDAHLADVKHSPASVGETKAGKIDKGTIPLDENSDTPLKDMDDYKAKKKALQDLLMDPDASKDPRFKKLIQQRMARLEQQKAQLGVPNSRLDPQQTGGSALDRAEKYADDKMKKKTSFDPNTAFDIAKGGTLGYGALMSLLAEAGLNESHMSEVDLIIQDIIDGELDAYDILSNPKSPEEKFVSQILQKEYDDVSIDNHLHPDDDFEKILDIVVDRLAHDYKHEELDEVDMGQADRTLRYTPRGDDDGKMGHIEAFTKAAKKMGHGHYMDVPDDEVEKLKALAKKLRSGEEVEEGLDANQKRAGQLGPTEKVGPKGAVGKLVGANESIERDPLDDLKRLLGK